MSGSSRPVAAVMLEFQAVMEQFLDLQRAMLPAYLDRGRGLQLAPPATAAAAFVSTSSTEATPEAETTLRLEPSAIVEVEQGPDAGDESAGGAVCGRYRVVLADRPRSGARASLARDHVIVVTGDGRGIADRVGERLRTDGHRVVIVATSGAPDERRLVSPLDSPEEAGRLVAEIVERQGPIAALVHLMPLAPPADRALDADAAWARLCHDSRTLFLLAQAVGAELERASTQGGAALIACTGIDGALGHGPAGDGPPHTFPGQAAVLGFTKCLAIEWPGVRVRAVDLDPSENSEALAEYVLDELWARESGSEVGYASGRRVALEIAAAVAEVDPGFDLPGEAVVLATGGARGITADVCLELAERYQPTFVLVGQSPPPDLESAETAGLTSPADLKRALLGRLKAAGGRVTPAMVEKAYHRIEKEREIRRNIGALTAAGARLHYVQLDVRDATAFGALIDDIYATYGRLDGVIHGAGVIEDKLVRDKALDSFERVLGTKAISAFVLSRHLRPESLRFLVFFSSVAGRFGNRGQADYAAANEVVSKLALALNRQWPGRICSLAWAPWDKRGMVSPELKREFMRRGVELVSPEAGRRACWVEIQQTGSSDAEIVIGGAAPVAVAASPAMPLEYTPLPLLVHAQRETSVPGTVRFARLLDVSIDRYLDDHRLDDRPVLPLAVATELMAEAAQASWPDLTVVAVRNLQLFKGVVVEDGPVPLVVTVRAAVHSGEDGLTHADVDITTPTLVPPVRYRAVVALGPRLPEPRPFDAPVTPLTPLGVPLERAYRDWTFHGPVFRRVTDIAGTGPDALRGTIFSATSVAVVAGVTRPAWIIDPFVFDAALQLVLIWSRARNGMTALPTRFQAFHRFGSLSDRPLICFVAVESTAGGHALKNDIHFVDAAGRVIGILEGVEANCSAALNRLTGRDAVAVSAR